MNIVVSECSSSNEGVGREHGTRGDPYVISMIYGQEMSLHRQLRWWWAIVINQLQGQLQSSCGWPGHPGRLSSTSLAVNVPLVAPCTDVIISS